MKKTPTPLLDVLKKYSRSNPVRMHMPCHEGRLGLSKIEKTDVTELGFNDNLNAPCGAIAAAQDEYAKLFGAKRALFLTNGSSQGNFAFLGLVRGKSVLTERDGHVSLTRGAETLGVTLFAVDSVTPERVKEYKEKHDVAAVIVRYPDYFGRSCDLQALFKATGEQGVLLFVDGAHGAHFGLNKRLPPCPVGFCDACVVSTHKTLGAYTQTAVVLSNSDRIADELKKQINAVSTTSPSYILLASIDYARKKAAEKGEKKLDRLFGWVSDFEKKLPDGVYCMIRDDFTKLTLDFSEAGFSGKAAYTFMTTENIYPELYRDSRVLFYLGLYTTKRDLDKLARAVKKLIKKGEKSKSTDEGEGPFGY